MLPSSSVSGAHRPLHSFPTRRSSDLVEIYNRKVKLIGNLFNIINDLNLNEIQRGIISDATTSFRFRSLMRSEEHTSELQSRFDLVCRLLLEKKKNSQQISQRTTCRRL